MASQHILVVDDEARIREVVQYALEQAGYRVSLARDGADAERALAPGDVDLLVLDIMLPDTDGLELCRKLRAGAALPILFLSARGEEIDRVVGLEVGGDDYLTKPFSPRELVARVKAVLRRDRRVPVGVGSAAGASDATLSVLRLGEIRLDGARREVRCGAAAVELTVTEFDMLAALLRRPGVVLTRAQLVEQARGVGTHVTERSVDTHVRRIRAKFRVHGVTPIRTVHGIGYKASEA